LLPSDKSLGYYQPSLRDSGTLAQYELPIKFSEEPHFLICAFAPLRETPFSFISIACLFVVFVAILLHAAEVLRFFDLAIVLILGTYEIRRVAMIVVVAH